MYQNLITAFTHFDVADGLVNGFVYDIYIDRKGDIWFATLGGGVSVLHDTTMTSVRPIIPPVQSVPFFSLCQNYPNPFNPETTIDFEIAASAHVALEIYNMLGQKIATLIDEKKQAGFHQIIWNGTDDLGWNIGSGVYFYRIKAGGFEATRKFVLLR